MHTFKVLLLESIPYQLLTIHQQLNAFGIFQALTADEAEQAQDLLRRRGTQDILICDLPAGNAASQARLAWLAQRDKHDFQALIIHGNVRRPGLEQTLQHARSQGIQVLGFLQAPYSPHALHRLLESYRPAAQAKGLGNAKGSSQGYKQPCA